ncbi:MULTISPECIES: hypothetical protein [unclassified Sphingobacterium]|uniref:hypothetical protein n=1 Tax=unclassified Sphingobacterium TaxID=2609468 RepID=UPI0010D5E56A|nr:MULTISPECIES: hypothetical protein [unclassified Sphingobacterium]MCS3556805.1 ABC-type phosphate/phosphonate transport system permease subunit [Sphingobacterium sp. JUb21]QQD11641.1 hypothetical protein JAZ75_13470 [Sphingobacterium sp. UDSM-2020]TCQ99269.1 hypothetical protein EDF66_11582 [Sphingobacterium sp. JUb20]
MKLNDIRFGALGGTLCSLWLSLTFNDLLQTALMAVVGTVVSFMTSKLLGMIRKKE